MTRADDLDRFDLGTFNRLAALEVLLESRSDDEQDEVLSRRQGAGAEEAAMGEG